MAGDYNSMEHENSRFNGDNTLPENDGLISNAMARLVVLLRMKKLHNIMLIQSLCLTSKENLTTQEDICMMTQHGIISL